ncbi:MAG: gfo/Idh/MocA family oxidoreductase [Candidatus Nephthysia bennettiae]|uniref:Gfo/Idh/MocA family oxidoreductase n=1 Tax=Candidatus Nephthysia bennettiae TaxID=3127016 RepID=A0A934K1K8_9BACT|nr:Gfo/Idh/MocA family oxidoreductase [Candidatus Dormibacteraeota bacterium]PZR95279.1 MAG: gfo/Idh/MocA family oxidoreductase [Candidatus Dormibacteraeota bacterium]
MRFAVIGAGAIGTLHAETIANLPGAELAAVVDVRPEAARSLAERYGVCPFSDLDQALGRPEIEAVAICTPSGSHADLVQAALSADKHVVVEKPLDVSLEAADRVAAAERASRRRVTVISQHRFDAASRIVFDAIRSGRFGNVTSGSAVVAWWRSQAYYDSAGWRGTWALDGGGALMNQGIHTLDLLLWFLGEPVEVFAWAGRLAHERIEVEDAAVATIRFAQGALGVIHATTAAYPGMNARVQLHGDRGSAVIDDDRLAYFHAAQAGGAGPDLGSGSPDNQAGRMLEAGGPSQQPVGGRTSHSDQYEDFISSVADDRPPLVTVREAARTLAVVIAVYESAQSGRPARVRLLDGVD